jgi:hypothetical protein
MMEELSISPEKAEKAILKALGCSSEGGSVVCK